MILETYLPVPAGARDGVVMVWDARVPAVAEAGGEPYHNPVAAVQVRGSGWAMLAECASVSAVERRSTSPG